MGNLFDPMSLGSGWKIMRKFGTMVITYNFEANRLWPNQQIKAV